MPTTSTNPYESPIEKSAGDKPVQLGNLRQGRRIYIALIVANAITMIIASVMLADCYISFAPSVTASNVQNLFKSRIMFFVLLIASVQIYSTFILLNLWKSYDLKPHGPKQ